MNDKFVSIFPKIALFIAIGLFVLMEITFASSTFINHQSNNFSVSNKGIVTAPADTIIDSISEDGHFCFISLTDSSAQLCSVPAPRPNNKNAEVFQGTLPTGKWTVKDAGIYVDSNISLIYNNNNLWGFIVLSLIMTLMFGGVVLVALSKSRPHPENE